MRSLRVRLVLAAILVATVAVAASAWFSRRVVTSEYQRLVIAREPVDFAPVVHALAAHWRANGSVGAADTVLARTSRQIGHALVLADSAGNVVAASAPPLRTAHIVATANGVVTVSAPGPGRGTSVGLRLELRNPPAVLIERAPGERIGTLYSLPEPDAPRPSRPVFLASVDRGFALGAAFAIALGALLIWFLSGRIAGPIGALTAAAGRMRQGDLTPRVEARGDDEVAALARSFNAMADSLSHASELRRQMTRDVAHELRTPLTQLRAQVEAMQDGIVAAGPETLSSLHEEVLLLSRLVEDLEQLARADSGELRLEVADVDVGDALESAATAFRARGAEAGVTVEAPRPVPPLSLRADPVRLGQVLRNLVANAVTHTPRGGRVALTASRRGDTIELVVADTGEGIAAEHLPHVFERFYRADRSRSRATGGSGVGLAIVRRFVELHGGTVVAESEPGRATRMIVRLPVDGPGSGTAAAPSPTRP